MAFFQNTRSYHLRCLSSRSISRAWTVPIEAVISFVGSTKVFVIRAGKAHAVLVTPGLEGQGWLEIVRSASPELRLEDQVVTSGLEKLAEGVPVRVRETGESAK
jgi:hypothetical protein